MEKKSKIALLDCTLRDGGYVNDWEFGQNNLLNILSHLVSADIDYIEVGFLDQRRPFDVNRSIMPDTACAERIYGRVPKHNSQIVGMIDFGTCDISHIQPCSESYLDGIRVIFKKHLKEKALDFCRQLKELGYKVFAQAVSITSYDDEELLDLIALANEVKPYALSIVDTYGLLHKNNLFHIYEIMDKNLDESIGIGYHSHNNFQLGYSNCIELMNLHAHKNRLLLCDGSVFGMGKGAGNAPTELLAMYCNDNFSTHYNISHLLEAVDVSVMDIYRRSPWGYSMKFFIAASNDCHPNYVTYLLEKKTLTVESINAILESIEPAKKLMYDGKHIEDLYVKFQRSSCDDAQTYDWLAKKIADRKVLVIGPGASIVDKDAEIKAYVDSENPIIISINFVPPTIRPDIVFFTNSKRYLLQITGLFEGADYDVVATSNVTGAKDRFDHALDYESLIDDSQTFPDNSFLMLMRVLMRIGVKQVALAGLDGYEVDKSETYFNSLMDYRLERDKADSINASVNKFLAEVAGDIKIEFITPTVYKH